MDFAAIRQFLRDNPRVWIAGLALLGIALIIVGMFGGFTFGLSRYFAGYFGPGLTCETIGTQPAVKGKGKFYHSTCSGDLATQYGISPTDPIAGCDGVLDFTPLTADNQEAYPAQDPHWTCTGPFTLGRDTCFSPRGRITGKGTVSCTADMGAPLGVQTITFTVTKGAGGAAPGASETPGPPVSCTPQSQTVGLRQPASAEAIGGVGTYQWDVTGGGIVQSGGNESISVTYGVPGTKTLRVNSGGQTGTCTVIVSDGAAGSPAATTTMTAPATVVTSALLATPVTVSISTGTSGAGATAADQAGGTGTAAAQAGGVKTGPGDAVILALVVAASTTLLYTAYTRSGAYARKEAEGISEKRDPMDFRS